MVGENKEGTHRGRRAAAALWIAGLLVAVGGVVFWRVMFGGPPRMPAETYRQLLDAKNVSLGLLENLRLDEADSALVELGGRLPEELFPVRNLAVCRLLSVMEGQGDKQAAQQAIEAALAQEDQSPESLWLAAAFLTFDAAADDLQLGEAARLLRVAADKAPENLRVRFELYRATRYSRDEQLREMGRQALAEAYELSPNNIHLLLLWLELLAERQDPALAEALAKAKQTVAPLETQIERETRVSISQLIDQAIETARSGAPDETRGAVQRIRNLLIFPEVTRRDLDKIQAHPLDMTLLDLSEDFYARAPAGGQPPAAYPVAYQPLPADDALASLDPIQVLPADMNLDGREDLVVLEDDAVRIFAREEDEGAWREIVSASLPSGMKGLLLGDLDRDRALGAVAESAADQPEETVRGAPSTREQCHDADMDLIVYGEPGVVALRNLLQDAGGEGRAVLEPIEQASPAWAELAGLQSGVLADVDHDADLDLILAGRGGMSVWLCLGESMQFEDASQWSVLPEGDRFPALTAVDWDRDVDIDVIVAGAGGRPPGVLENLRHARFTWAPWDGDWPAPADARSVAVVESDGNVSWDFLFGGPAGVELVQTATPLSGRVQPLRVRDVAADAVLGAIPLDFDNDSHFDLAAWTDDELRLFRGDAAGEFREVADLRQPLPGLRQVAAGDLNNDGALDLAAATATGVQLLANQGGGGSWLRLRAMGRIDNRGRCNHTGIGSIVEVKSGDRYQAQVIDGQSTHFGLGDRPRADVVRIVWTNGLPQSIIEPPAEMPLCELMVLKGSCPYLYTWTGDGFEFLTDCLWAAPLGLQVADGVPAPSRVWEYLRIPGERLQEDEGKYRLQITEELWEAAYFDQVELLAVDHPADFEIYSNEKVGPAEIAEFRVHTVRQPRQVVAARDQRGRDLMSQLAAADGDFVKAFDRRRWQGLTEEHFLELDLGDLRDAERITLFLTGWIYPTDTSLNIAFSQTPELNGPRLPEVWAPDASGQWRRSIAYMGFPGGKTKTIAVDLSEAFLAEDYRVRIKTTAEIYWDQAFFTVDEKQEETRIARLQPASADLHYRGYSRRLPAVGFGPERYDYDDVATARRWPPMRGRFTRYGEVGELLRRSDDQMAILGAGDEMTVEFDAPPPPPAGWKRDFLLHCVGWDKDADLNTYHGQSVEPLPFQGMQSYPYAAGESYPDTPAHRRYLDTYQTRRQNAARFWRQVKDWPPASPSR